MAGESKSTRRQFLQGRAAAKALLDRANENARGEAAPAAPPPTYLLHFSRAAMACEFEIFFNAGEDERAGEAALEIFDLVEQLEDQLTVYRESSEVSRLNRRAAESAVSLEPRLFRLLERAKEIHAATGGAFDITAGPLTRVWGFFRRAGCLPSEGELSEARERVGSQFLVLDSQACTARFDRPGLEINLGAIGKGYALDRCAEWLCAAGLESYALHGGMSSVLARGERAGAAQGGWTIGLVHPQRPDRRLAEIFLKDRALGTSGAGTQFFHHGGERYGHILDPRTGWPSAGVLSATVLAPTAAEADALATAFYVLGVSETRRICQDRPDLAALFVLPGPRSGSVMIETIQLADDDWRECPAR